MGGDNTASGGDALYSNTTGLFNVATGNSALGANTSGRYNTGIGYSALLGNTTGSHNTVVGDNAGTSVGTLSNATAIGSGAMVNASNKVRLGNDSVTVIAGHVGFTVDSDRNQKENFRPVDGESVLGKVRELKPTSWNYIGHDPKKFRHYGPMAQDFFAAFGHDGVGTIGTDTTITSTDMDGILMIVAQTLEKRSTEQARRAAEQNKWIDRLSAENAELKSRLEALEQRLGCNPLAKAE